MSEKAGLGLAVANEDGSAAGQTGSSLHFFEYFGDYPCVTNQVVDFLIQTGKKGVGLDTIGLDPIADGNLTLHRQLLSTNKTVIIENLCNLDKLPRGLFTFCALPLRYENADGSPIRAVAILED